jgi:hypothetical protein
MEKEHRNVLIRKIIENAWENLDNDLADGAVYNDGRGFINDCLYFGFKGFSKYTDAELLDVFNTIRISKLSVK